MKLREFVDDVGRRDAGDTLEETRVLADHAAISYLDRRQASRVFAEFVAERVDVGARRKHNAPAADRQLEGLDPVAGLRRGLEPGVGGRLLHLRSQLRQYAVVLPPKEAAELPHGPAVFRRRHRADAWAQASPQMVVEAGTFAGALLRRPRTAAPTPCRHDQALADAEDATRQPDRLPHGAGRQVGSVVSSAVARDGTLPNNAQGRILFAQVDPDIGVALVVPIPDVEPRTVLLDEVELENQRLLLRLGHHDVQIADERNHEPRPRVEIGAWLEVRPHAASQGLRLPDVEDIPRNVLVQVHAGTVRQILYLLFKCCRSSHGHRNDTQV
jgi:hypothetical protein